MKTILCYGDSNTYGYNPENFLRYGKDRRWTGILSNLLGSGYEVLEEGCNSRTTAFDDPTEDWVNGMTYLKTCLKSHMPIDIFVLMLGSNDLKNCFNVSAREIAEKIREMVRLAKDFSLMSQGYAPTVILVSPPLIGEDIHKSPFYPDFDESAVTRSRLLAAEYKSVAKAENCLFYDAGPVAEISFLDQVHLSEKGHHDLGQGLFEFIKNI